MPTILDLTDENFDVEVLDASALVVIGFWSWRCELCQPMLDVLRRMTEAHPEIKFGRVDVTKSPEVVKAFDLKAIPHIAFALHGDVVFESVGARTFEELEQALAPFIKVARTA
jgi:thioredoxin 1